MNGKAENGIEDATQQLLEELREVVADGEELLRAGAEGLNDQGRAARARLSAALAGARETGRKLQQRTIAGARVTDQAIRDHPYESIGIAFGAGLLIGILIRR